LLYNMIIGTSGIGNDMEIFIFVFLLYYGAKFLFLLFEFLVDFFIVRWESYMSRKNRLIIRHWEWLIKIGYHEAAEIIVKKIR